MTSALMRTLVMAITLVVIVGIIAAAVIGAPLHPALAALRRSAVHIGLFDDAARVALFLTAAVMVWVSRS